MANCPLDVAETNAFEEDFAILLEVLDDFHPNFRFVEDWEMACVIVEYIPHPINKQVNVYGYRNTKTGRVVFLAKTKEHGVFAVTMKNHEDLVYSSKSPTSSVSEAREARLYQNS